MNCSYNSLYPLLLSTFTWGNLCQIQHHLFYFVHQSLRRLLSVKRISDGNFLHKITIKPSLLCCSDHVRLPIAWPIVNRTFCLQIPIMAGGNSEDGGSPIGGDVVGAILMMLLKRMSPVGGRVIGIRSNTTEWSPEGVEYRRSKMTTRTSSVKVEGRSVVRQVRSRTSSRRRGGSVRWGEGSVRQGVRHPSAFGSRTNDRTMTERTINLSKTRSVTEHVTERSPIWM